MQTAQKSHSDYPVQAPPPAEQPKTRDELLWLATTRFCREDRQNLLSVEQYKEAFYLLINDVSPNARKLLSGYLAGSEYTPRQMALYFAMDDIDIARPMLCNSRALGQLDLLQIVDRQSIEHSIAIASRPDLGPSLIRRLNQIGDERVLKALEDNYALVEPTRRRSVEALFTEIDRRRAEDEKSKLADQSVQAAQPVARHLNEAENALLSAAARGGRLDGASPAATNKPLPIRDIGTALERAAKAHSSQAMAVLMQKHTGLTLDTCYRVLEDKTGDTMAVYLKSCDVEDAQANRILLLSQPTIGLSVHNAMRAVRFYAKLNNVSCRDAVAKWPHEEQTAATAVNPQHQPVLQDGKAEQKTSPRRIETTVQRIEWASESTEKRSA